MWAVHKYCSVAFTLTRTCKPNSPYPDEWCLRFRIPKGSHSTNYLRVLSTPTKSEILVLLCLEWASEARPRQNTEETQNLNLKMLTEEFTWLLLHLFAKTYLHMWQNFVWTYNLEERGLGRRLRPHLHIITGAPNIYNIKKNPVTVKNQIGLFLLLSLTDLHMQHYK